MMITPLTRLVLATAAGIVAAAAWAGTLPADRADLLYHRYDGDNARIDGPALLMRKSLGRSFSVSGKYYVDSVSSASVDVVTSASPYEEQRTEKALGVNYLHGNTQMSVGVTNSEENDYTGNSAYFNVTQDVFGGLTTVSLGYGIGQDEVRRRGDELFAEDLDRQQYRIGLTQVLTRNWLVDLTFETITDEGFLNNPYRSVRYLDGGDARGYQFEPEVYPRTRTSNSAGFRSRYFLGHRAALHGSYRYFTDTWDIEAHTAEVGYVQPVKWGLEFEINYRYYTQSEAEFYRDLFSRPAEQNFRARDKEMSSFSNHGFRLGLRYEFEPKGWKLIDKGSVNFVYDHIEFDYENFRDLTVSATPGEEPLFSFGADVVQIFFSLWY